MIIYMTVAEHEAFVQEQRKAIIARTDDRHLAVIEEALNEHVPESLWERIVASVDMFSAEGDPHLLVGLKMFPICLSVQYYRPNRPSDPWRSVSMLFS